MLTLILKLLRKGRYTKLAVKRYFKWLEYNRLYQGRISIADSCFFDQYFNILVDDLDSSVEIRKNIFFRDYCRIVAHHGGKVIINDGVFFNHGCSVNSLESITIGENSIFGENVCIYDHNHRFSDCNKPIKDQGYTTAAVEIGKNCWIGSNVTILKGVSIGDNCVIGANCLIYKSIPSDSIIKNAAKFVAGDNTITIE